MKQQLVMIYVTFPDNKTAHQICNCLLEENLIACANIFSPHISLYRWEGKVNQESEIAVLLKTRLELFPTIQQKILSLHPYQCPCITMFTIEDAYTDFSKWIYNQTIHNEIL